MISVALPTLTPYKTIMMMNNYIPGSLTYGHHLHLLFGIFLLLGAIMLVIWAAKFTKKEELKNWIIGLGVIGLIGWFLTASMSGFSGWGFGRGMMSDGYGPGMMTPGMIDCIQDEECHEEMEEVMHRMMGIEE